MPYVHLAFSLNAAAMTEFMTAKVDSYDCIGVLSIPVPEIELPVLTDRNYAKLKIAPGHYYGYTTKRIS